MRREPKLGVEVWKIPGPGTTLVWITVSIFSATCMEANLRE